MSMTRSLFIARKREERWVIAGEREGGGRELERGRERGSKLRSDGRGS